MKSSKLLGLIFLLSSGASAQQTLTENFSDFSHLDGATTTAVWNIYYHMAHVPLYISYTTGANNQDLSDASVGTGVNGAFDVSNYSTFGSVSGTTLTINTAVWTTIQVTYLYVPAGWTIRGAGPNPLWFKVQGTVTINGTIDCSGENGANADNITTSPTIGGLGHCSGGNGGNGGYNGTLATQGTPTAGSVTGGVGATGTNGDGGGGGGGYRAVTGLPQAGAGGTPGAAGTQFAGGDTKFTTFAGGAGGGGGSYNSGAASRGASGGGGGGVVRITSIGDITIGTSGHIYAKGGVGGVGTAPAGGGGGGGAGGGIWLQTVGGVFDNNPSTSIDAGIEAGVYSGAPDGDNGGVIAGGNKGGRGSDGRTWITVGNSPNAPSITPPGWEIPVSDLIDPGETHYSTQPGYIVQSLAYDARNTSPTYVNFVANTTLPNTSTFSLLVAGSNDNFVKDNTGFVALGNLSSLATKRWFKFQGTLQLIPAAAPATQAASLNSLTAISNGVSQNNFNFTQACGYIGGGPGESLFLFLEFFAIYLFTNGRLRRKILSRFPNKI